MQIIHIPENKKIKKLKPVNEGFFDSIDTEDVLGNDEGTFEPDGVLNSYTKLIEEEEKPKIEKWLKQYKIQNYEIICTGKGIYVDVNTHLYLPNLKLTKLPDNFSFRKVKGTVNFANNRFKDFSQFPRYIDGDCIAAFNRIFDFTGVPHIKGSLFAEKQRVRTKYPLTQENYNKWLNDELNENRVHIQSKNQYGILKNINERENYAEVLIEGGSFNKDIIEKFPLDDIDVIDSLELLENININGSNNKG